MTWFPHKLWIKGRTFYLIVWVDRFDSDTDTHITRGECCSKAKHIYIRKGLSDRETIETLVHELFHAIEFEYKIKIPHALIYRLEKIVVNMLIKNGVTLRWEGA